jgi:RNA polymerase sigma-70 factor, ECF subfamily
MLGRPAFPLQGCTSFEEFEVVALPAFTSIPHPEIDSLVAGAAAGDVACFDALYRRASTRVYNLVLRSCGEPSEAEDVCQEVWTRVHRSIGHLHDAGAFDSWVMRIASRACIDAARRRRIDYDETKLAAMADEHDVSDAVEGDEQRRLAWQALATLAPRQRIALYLREVDGRRYNEIAEAIGATPSAVETLLFRARHALAQAYGRLADSPDERCQRARHLMAVVLDGEGDAAEQRSLKAHLNDCHGCQRQMFTLHRGRRNYAALPFIGAAAASPALLPASGGGLAGLGALLGLGRLSALFGKATSASLPALTAATLTVAGAAAASPLQDILPGSANASQAAATAGISASSGRPLTSLAPLIPAAPAGPSSLSPARPLSLPQPLQVQAQLNAPAQPVAPPIPSGLPTAPSAPLPDSDPLPTNPLPPVVQNTQQLLPPPPPIAPPALPGLPTLPPVAIPEVPPLPLLPQVTLPAVTTPSVTVPSVTLPQVLNLPPVTLPQVTVPQVVIPQVTVPSATLPSATLPSVPLPLPTTNLPSALPQVLPQGTLPSNTTAPPALPSLPLPNTTTPPPALPSVPLPTLPVPVPNLPGGLKLPLP